MKLHNLFALLSALLFTAFQAQAGIITDIEEINQRVGGLIQDDQGLRLNIQSISWFHDLSDTPFSLGTATSATLSIELSDDNSDVIVPFERAVIVVGSLDFVDDSLFYEPNADWSRTLGINSLVALNDTGQLNVEVLSVLGTDFLIGNSILAVTTTAPGLTAASNLEAVPEPGALLMLGFGLAGLAASRPKRRD